MHVVQGSGIGTILFTICIIDLELLGSSYDVTKYADDSSLAVPEQCNVDIRNLLKEADANKLKLI